MRTGRLLDSHTGLPFGGAIVLNATGLLTADVAGLRPVLSCADFQIEIQLFDKDLVRGGILRN